MSEATNYRLGDLQLRIMRVLWRFGPLGVADVREKLDGDDLAYTTVATMLRKMEDRGLVGHETQDRKFILCRGRRRAGRHSKHGRRPR